MVSSLQVVAAVMEALVKSARDHVDDGRGGGGTWRSQ